MEGQWADVDAAGRITFFEEKPAAATTTMAGIALYFYPKADTPGCTTQACGVRDAWGEFERSGAVAQSVAPCTVAGVTGGGSAPRNTDQGGGLS